MSKAGVEAAFCADGDPPDDVLAPPAKVPPLDGTVGYPAGKLVVKPGRLVMARAEPHTEDNGCQ